jgi:chromosome segregation ATPase
MEFALGLIALIVAAVALAVVFRLQGEVGRVREAVAAARREATLAQEAAEAAGRDFAQARLAADGADYAVTELRADVTKLRDELTQLRSAIETPPPPLPRARTSNLEDLRERLRAEQEAADDDDET